MKGKLLWWLINHTVDLLEHRCSWGAVLPQGLITPESIYRIFDNRRRRCFRLKSHNSNPEAWTPDIPAESCWSGLMGLVAVLGEFHLKMLWSYPFFQEIISAFSVDFLCGSSTWQYGQLVSCSPAKKEKQDKTQFRRKKEKHKTSSWRLTRTRRNQFSKAEQEADESFKARSD